MNHSWRFMTHRYSGVPEEHEAYNVWTESFYASTVRHATTAQINAFFGPAFLG